MSRAINIGRSSSLSYSKLAYYLGLFKNDHLKLLNTNGIRCEDQIAKLSTLSADVGLTIKRKKLANKKTKKLITNVINVTDVAVTSKTAKVRRLKKENFVDVNGAKSALSELQINALKKSSSENLLQIFDLSNTCSPDYFRKEFQDHLSDEKESEYFDDYLVDHKNESIDLEHLEERLTGSENIQDSIKATTKKRSLPKRHSRKGLSDEALKKLIDQMKSNSKIYSFNCNLEAFLSVCNNGNSHLQETAYSVFMHYAENKKQFQIISDIKVYNEALKCLEKLKHRDVQTVSTLLKESDIEPNVDTFALILSCLGHRPKSPEVLAAIQYTLQWMDKQKITLGDLYRDSVLPQESIKFGVQAILRVKDDPNVNELLSNGLWNEKSLQIRNMYKNELLNSLNNSIYNSQVSSPAEGVINLQDLEKFTNEQLQLELKGFIKVPSIAKLSNKKKTQEKVTLLHQWEEEWRDTLKKVINDQMLFRRQNFLKGTMHLYKFDMYPFYSSVSTEELVDLIILEINKLCAGLANGNMSLDYLYYFLGCRVYKRYLISYKHRSGLLKNMESVYQDYKKWYLNESNSSFSCVPRIQLDYIINSSGNAILKDTPPEWPYPVKKSVGLFLYNILISSVKICDPKSKDKISFAGFTKVHRQKDNKRWLGLEISPFLVNVYKMTERKTLFFSPEDLPMVVPPVPWTSPKFGGYLITQTDFIRHVPHAHLQKKRIAERDIQQIFPIADSLNQLGSIPWKINGVMLDFIIKSFNDSGWQELDLCSAELPDPVPPNYAPSMTKEERKALRYQKMMYKKKSKENHSLWCDTLYKLSLANFYRDRVIWLPQNIDFRGRTYPIPPHLTHLSADLFRSTLLFAHGKKLGKEGLMWLKLHIINLTGLKKRCSMQERIEFVEVVLDDIIDSANNPIGGRRWWTKSDEPWQTLAACKELANALESDNPEEFISHLPIHQDGSCNGLQHYAALGRDERGAKSVNLKPSLVPQDIYSDVVKVVEEKRKRDAKEGNEIANELEGFVIRKVIKQTIMTTVYGVTQYGAQEQIARQLKYLDFPPKRVKYASYYLAVATFESLGILFTPTQKIQNWLVKCADGLSHICLQNVEWVTPLGLPVVQPYTNVQELRAGMCIPGQIPLHFSNDQFAVPNRLKQKNAFPPNFIHSLDSSHMMLTSIYCQHSGISFVSIHDCFWTHACTVPLMSKICREQFIKLHSQPILGDLSKFILWRISDYKLLCSEYLFEENSGLAKRVKHEPISAFEDHVKRVPRKGDFNLNEVANSVYFFS